MRVAAKSRPNRQRRGSRGRRCPPRFRKLPELPEVETVRRDLERAIVGKRILRAEATNARVVRRHSGPAEFVASVEGRTPACVRRVGKYLIAELDDERPLVIHLGMSGQLWWKDAGGELARHTHVVLGFGSGELRYVDPRTFGEMHTTGTPTIGLDAVDGIEDAAHLGRLLRARRRRVKDLLMDQQFVAGIGNIYSDEILFDAALRHDRSSATLTDDEVVRLHRAIVEILGEAIELRGSSLADLQYRDLFGQIGSYQTRHRVYDREDEPCVRCGSPVVRIKYGGRSHFSCVKCQR